jgi:hypothetical protein
VQAASMSEPRELNEEIKNLLLFPRETKSVDILPSQSCLHYLEQCKTNLLSDYWAFFKKNVNPRRNPFWRNQMKCIRVQIENFCISNISLDENSLDLQEVSWNLVLYENTLCLLVPAKKSENDTFMLRILQGKEIDDPYNTESSDYMHILGYVKPYFAELNAIMQLQQNFAATILSQVASPDSRTSFNFATNKDFLSNVPSNDFQRSVIGSLRHCIECIQGPPGTGKSTTIFHIQQNS